MHPLRDPVVKCPKCGHQMTLRTSPYARRDGSMQLKYSCTQYGCDTSVGAHPDGSVMGIPANAVTRRLRVQAHDLCNKIWGDYKTIPQWKKKQMYDWLNKNTKSGHMSQMLEPELRETILKLEQEFAWRVHNSKKQ